MRQEGGRVSPLPIVGLVLALAGIGFGVWAAFQAYPGSLYSAGLRIRILCYVTVPFLLVLTFAIVGVARPERGRTPGAMLIGIGSWLLAFAVLRYLVFLGERGPGSRGLTGLASAILVLASGIAFLAGAHALRPGSAETPLGPVAASLPERGEPPPIPAPPPP